LKQRKNIEWSTLDNASKLFPATSNSKDTKVFRAVCELKETVNPEILQQALDVTIEHFPLYKSVLRRGIFWYYLESSDIKPIVEIESKPVCAPLYLRGKTNLLFRVFYYNNRINLEIFHALSDGAGALLFLQTLVYNYLVMKHKDVFSNNKPVLDYNASLYQQTDDSFRRHYSGDSFRNLLKLNHSIKAGTKAYHVKGSRLYENRTKVIEGSMSAKAVLEQAHKFGATLTVFLASVFIYSIYRDMPKRKKKLPVVLSVPINLRQFFKSKTTRNFFSTINVGYDFSRGSDNFEDIVQTVSNAFSEELNEEKLNKHLNRLVSLERLLFTRIVPLPLKNYGLRMAQKISDRGVTATISNLGRISMPAEFDDYIRQFSFLVSARMPQILMCSYGDRLVVSFTSPFWETEIQRMFFKFLSKLGIEIEITSNQRLQTKY
jgi:NRPS condensation-like uncharacterized protein